MQHELRSTERIRSFLRAQITYNNRMTTIDCIIKNYSVGGARIALSDTLAVPSEFDVFVPAKQRSHHARLVWRDKDSIGVSFIDAAQQSAEKPIASHAGAEAAARLRDLEAQNVELKRRVQELSKRLEDLGQDPTIAA
ncbi:PilZ domain-containing protein [Methylovirgula ligni]|uniref:PilZ domain-containing protein n=2 Tax=Methylovirgula ligni TaxID=569860 RepID=A0A3D9YTC7_9HYPH|nr:PilZ domain-containing protein [Methylovirgula ligni]REF84142.1 PilZ domain-containing protein [Methylovirgula ligni]